MDPGPQHSARIFVEPYDVDLRLHQLGLSRPPFIRAALEGDLQRRLCTADDFYATPGYSAWARALRVVRQELRDLHGWHNGDFLRIPVSFSDNEARAVAVSTGDDRTGLPGPDPSTNAKGPSTVAAVEESAQGAFNFDSDEMGVELWYLLTYAGDDGVLQAELSWPRFIDEQFKISGWYERIIIGRIDPGGEARTIPPVAPSDITINISRKSA